ncbi:phage tail tape measure protein [Klebsiella michiganensis]|uniref:phage tail tape measure protein n=1 Tax=Klebsiella michiganensis TaxID=1134687 RepID=UPI000CE27683|nr:phage tail tape measure protein [Klebsiella michiganensis]KAB7492652.1 phage tail tape measure protein [Klebsiella michiganensis]MDQ2564271.1 phage tail tape measure protein [Klebsiella michiganensis]PPA45101.1 phage tail tape measure protein [Klebsiella michiganensis]HBM3172387.1 phage tail tape measure protein [Klebsiella michiganensis]
MDLSIRVAFSAIDKLTRPVSAASKAIGGLSDSLKQTQGSIKEVERQSAAFNRLRDSVKKTSRTIDDTTRTLEGLKQAQRSGATLTDKQRQQMTDLAAKLDRLKVRRDKETESLRGASEALRRHGVSLAGGSQTIASAIRRTEQYNQTLERERRQLAAATQARMQYDRAKEIAGKMRGAGLVMTAASAGAGYLGARLMAPQIQTQEHASVIAAQNGEGAASGGRYSRIIQDINAAGVSRDLARISEAVAGVRSTLGALGEVGDDELTRISRKALDLQTALGGDMTEQIQMAAIMMKNGLARSSDEAFDLITSGMQRVSTRMRGEMPEILHEYSTHFRNMGFTGAETMSLLVSMAQQGKFALDKTGDAIKEFSIRGSDMSKNSVSAYKAIGLDAAVMSSAIATGGESARKAMEKTAKGLLSIQDPATRANAAISLFGTPIEDLSIDQIPAFLSALANVSNRLGDTRGSADRLGDTLRDNLPGDIGKLGGAFDGLRTEVLTGMDGSLRIITQTLTTFVNHLREWASENPELTQTLVLVAAALVALTGAIGVASLAVSFYVGPFAKLRLAIQNIGLSSITATSSVARLNLVLSGMRVILATLLGLPGLIALAFVAAGLVIWKFWEPIKAFFGGFLSGVWDGLTPLRNAFSALAPVFSVLGDGIKAIWGWFKNLLSPMQTSKDTLDKCASAGKTFGEILGTALNLLFTPLRLLTQGVSLLLEKLGAIPSSLDAAKAKANSITTKPPTSWEWDPKQKKMVQKEWGWSPVMWEWDPKQKKMVKKEWKPSVSSPSSPLGGNGGGVQGHLKNIETNTKATANNTKKVGPGDIVFKNLPRALALRGAYQEARVIPQPVPRVSAAAAGGVLSVPTATQGATSAPVAASSGAAPFFQLVFNDVGKRSDQELEKMVRNAVRDAMASTRKANRGSYRDRE